MNILDAILNAQDGAAVQQLGSQVGLAPDQTTAALSALMPALAGGFQRNIQSQGGLESLMAVLSSGNHSQYIDNPTSLADQSAVTDGNGILGHLLGGKDGGIGAMLTPYLDQNRDGSIIDDLTSMIGGFIKRS